MPVEDTIARHYTTGDLMARIRAGLAATGIDPDKPGADDLKAVDEFHIGGVAATRELVAQMGLGAGSRVLDLGSGLGGPARSIAALTGAHVTGIDLTPEYVATATALSEMVGMGERTSFVAGSALDLPFGAGSFDAATLIHVGMNLPDKTALFAGVARVLRPGGCFAVYDVMRQSDEPLVYPLPWAETPEYSFPAAPAEYRAAAVAAGFEVTAERNRRDFALAFFAEMRARIATAGGPPALGINLLMGPTTAQKIANMAANIEAGRIAPVEMICRLPG